MTKIRPGAAHSSVDAFLVQANVVVLSDEVAVTGTGTTLQLWDVARRIPVRELSLESGDGCTSISHLRALDNSTVALAIGNLIYKVSFPVLNV